MKKYALTIMCFIIFVSCKKENTAVQTESSTQLLTSVTKTTDIGGGGTYSIRYTYNDAGKLITEGSKAYYRDEQQRIVRIVDPGTPTSREDIHVYYNNANTGKVAYTLCTLTGGGVTDSVAYLHDDKGRLIKTISYISYFSKSGITDTTFLSEYDIFNYDTAGNLVRWDNYKNNTGVETHCSQFNFESYTKSPNPLYSGDEVRTMEFSWGGILNNSMNNFSGMGVYKKSYDYRTDGRPRSCTVNQAGVSSFKIIFEYK